MNISFDELFSLPDMKNAMVLAGHDSLDNPIEWFHLIEIEEMSNWIKSGILVFITGVGLKEPEQGLLNIVEILHHNNAAGLVINQGTYIPQIPDSVINKANKLSLPLILLPNKVKLLDVTFQLSNIFQKKQARLKQRDQIIYETIMSSSNPLLDFDNVDGFDSRFIYSVCELSHKVSDSYNHPNNTSSQSPVNTQDSISDTVYHIINSSPMNTCAKIPVLNMCGSLLLMVPFAKNSTYTQQSNIIKRIVDSIKISVDKNIYAGIGSASSSFHEIKTSYQEAHQALQIALSDITNRSVLHYKDLSLFRIVDLNNTIELNNIVHDCLGDLVNKPELLDTLFTYLENDRNMQATSEQLFVHVNSIKYRLQKIYDILPITIKSTYDWYVIQTAMYVYKYLSQNN